MRSPCSKTAHEAVNLPRQFFSTEKRCARRGGIASFLIVDSIQKLITVRDLLEQALALVDDMDETFLGALVNTALHEVIAKVKDQGENR